MAAGVTRVGYLQLMPAMMRDLVATFNYNIALKPFIVLKVRFS